MVMDGKIKWEKGKNASLSFYTKKLSWKVQQFNHKFPLPIYFDQMIGDKKEVSIADLGAGMFATTGTLWYDATIHLYPSDILADDYKKILDKYKIIPLVPVEKQDMENLTYKNEFFDIVHCANALDHCNNPYKALEEMVRVCKKGGWVYLRHMPDNGKVRRYSGLHQWDIKLVGDECFFSRDKVFKLSDFGEFHSEMKKEVGNEPKMIVSILHK